MTELRRYRGDGLSPIGTRFPYLADERLVTVVNTAIALEKPLLVKGPPGCGKTQLAAAIAHELGLELIAWYVKSTSQARDGLYSIDVVRRLQDAQLMKESAQRISPYIRFGPLANAFRAARRCVVLIDEIDKADIDFPNDLLRELDLKEFEIDELDETEAAAGGLPKRYRASEPPIIVITSNDEKELPDAFLRRCLFHWIDFPAPQRLCEIVEVNAAGRDLDRRLAEQAVRRLCELRKLSGFRKLPATSELIDWVKILHHWNVDLKALNDEVDVTELPYWELLFKHQADVQLVRRQGKPGQGTSRD